MTFARAARDPARGTAGGSRRPLRFRGDRESHFGAEIPITGVPAISRPRLGQACFEPGTLKATFGTGYFVLANSGDTKVSSAPRMLATILPSARRQANFALEGAIFMAGATVQWLRDRLGVIAQRRRVKSWRGPRSRNRGSTSFPLFRDWARRFGTAARAPRARAVARFVPGRYRGGGTRGRRLPEARPAPRHAQGHGGERRARSRVP